MAKSFQNVWMMLIALAKLQWAQDASKWPFGGQPIVIYLEPIEAILPNWKSFTSFTSFFRLHSPPLLTTTTKVLCTFLVSFPWDLIFYNVIDDTSRAFLKEERRRETHPYHFNVFNELMMMCLVSVNVTLVWLLWSKKNEFSPSACFPLEIFAILVSQFEKTFTLTVEELQPSSSCLLSRFAKKWLSSEGIIFTKTFSGIFFWRVVANVIVTNNTFKNNNCAFIMSLFY